MTGAAQSADQSNVLAGAGVRHHDRWLHADHSLGDGAEFGHGRRKQDCAGLQSARLGSAFRVLTCRDAAGRFDAVADRAAGTLDELGGKLPETSPATSKTWPAEYAKGNGFGGRISLMPRHRDGRDAIALRGLIHSEMVRDWLIPQRLPTLRMR